MIPDDARSCLGLLTSALALLDRGDTQADRTNAARIAHVIEDICSDYRLEPPAPDPTQSR